MCKRLKVIFARNNKPISLLIQLVTWSRWSHVALVLEGEHDDIIEARGGFGVVRTSFHEFEQRYTHTEVAYIPCEDSELAIRMIKSQLGKGYDDAAIFGTWFRTGWDNPLKWVCSELIAWSTGLYRPELQSRVTPEDLWRISK